MHVFTDALRHDAIRILTETLSEHQPSVKQTNFTSIDIFSFFLNVFKKFK